MNQTNSKSSIFLLEIINDNFVRNETYYRRIQKQIFFGMKNEKFKELKFKVKLITKYFFLLTFIIIFFICKIMLFYH